MNKLDMQEFAQKVLHGIITDCITMVDQRAPKYHVEAILVSSCMLRVDIAAPGRLTSKVLMKIKRVIHAYTPYELDITQMDWEVTREDDRMIATFWFRYSEDKYKKMFGE